MFDRNDVLRALRESRNIGQAARKLGASRRTLQARMRRYGIPRGQAGRPKRRLRYRGHAMLYAAGVAAAAGLGYLAFHKGKTA